MSVFKLMNVPTQVVEVKETVTMEKGLALNASSVIVWPAGMLQAKKISIVVQGVFINLGKIDFELGSVFVNGDIYQLGTMNLNKVTMLSNESVFVGISEKVKEHMRQTLPGILSSEDCARIFSILDTRQSS